MNIDLPQEMLRTFGWVCPITGCSEHGQAQILRGELQLSQQINCPVHDVPFIPLLDALDTAINCALSFIFDQSLLPPKHMQKHLNTVDAQTRRLLVYNWILNGTAVRASGDIAFYFRVLELNQIHFIKPIIALSKNARFQRNCVVQLNAVIEQKIINFVQAVNERTRQLIPPKLWQPPFGLNITAFEQWFHTDWENLKPQIDEILSDSRLRESPERYKQLVDLLVQGRTAAKYFNAPDLYKEELSSPQLIIHYARLLHTPQVVKTLTRDAIEAYLDQYTRQSPPVSSITASGPLQGTPSGPEGIQETPINLSQQIDSENISTAVQNSFSQSTTHVYAASVLNSVPEMVHRSYKAGIQAVLPAGLFANDPDPAAAKRSAQAVIRKTVANYATNLSRVVDSLCVQFSPAVIASAPNPNQHYGNLRRITQTSANIADSAHYLLSTAYKNYRETQIKLTTFDRFLHQDTFFLNTASWLFSGYCGVYLTATLQAQWTVQSDWIHQLVRGWRNRLESSLPLVYHRQNQIALTNVIWEDLIANFGLSRQLAGRGKKKGWLTVFLQPNPQFLSAIIPVTDLPIIRNCYILFHKQYSTNTAIQQYFASLLILSGRPTSFFHFSLPELQRAAGEIDRHLTLAITAVQAQNGNSQNLRSQRNKVQQILQDPQVLQILMNHPGITCDFRSCQVFGSIFGLILGKGKWAGIIAQLLAVAAFQQQFRQLSFIPTLTTQQLLGTPFLSQSRKRTTEPLLLTSPKYIFQRGNANAITTDIQNTGSFELKLPRKPCSAAIFIQHNRNLLQPSQIAKIHDEIDWGTSIKPFNVAIRQRLQSNPFFLALLGLPLTRSQRAELDRNPQLKQQVVGQHLAVKVRLSTGILRRIQRGATVQQLLFLPAKGPAKNPKVVIQMQGSLEQLELPPRFSIPRVNTSLQGLKTLGVDTNAVGQYVFEFAGINSQNPAQEIQLPRIPDLQAELDNLAHKAVQLTAVEQDIKQSQARLMRNACAHILRTKEAIRMNHIRRTHLKSEIDHDAPKLLLKAGIGYGASVLALEDLSSLHTRGKKGRLAKIITTMVKRQGPIVAKLRKWAAAMGSPLSIRLVDPHNTSKIHFVSGGICAGKITRTGDIGVCSRCGQQVGVHHNAALNIARRA